MKKYLNYFPMYMEYFLKEINFRYVIIKIMDDHHRKFKVLNFHSIHCIKLVRFTILE